LLKILAGVYAHGSFDGAILVDGAPRALRSTAEARAAGIAIVHQELMLVPEMTVAENLLLGREPRRFGFVDDAALEAHARALFARFGEDGIDVRAKVATLGIGVQQIVEIVRALQDDARLLVLDEPTAALTGDEAARLFDWLRALAARGTTCIYVSHRMDELFTLCHRITVLRDGKTVGTVETAQSSGPEVVRMMIGKEQAVSSQLSAVSSDAATILELRRLTVDGALTDVSLKVRAGEVVALAGAMGSGRTALLSTLFGCANTRVSGEILVDGVAVALDSPRAAIAAGFALVPEDRKGRGLVLDLTVAENLALPLALADGDAAETIARARIGELRIRGRADSPASTLSGGNQQKVVLGKWLHRPPRLLLLDEPTRGVDVGAREEIYALVAALCARGVAVLMASSDLPEVQRLADRIVVLRKGRVVTELPAGSSQDHIVAHSTGLIPSAANEPCTP
ncbi:MAG: ribose transport system, ATP-binding protein RbsA, partial [bacterium]|nr:ribose transport system, ATP-binding protein RbsA [bacterium]